VSRDDKKGGRFRPPQILYGNFLLECNHPECTCQIVVRTRGEKQLVFGAVVGGSAAKVDRPELINMDDLAFGVLHCADKLARDAIEGVDRAAVGIVGDQEGVAQRSKIIRSGGKTPGLVRGAP